jgi:hypothetical protein
MLATDWLLDQSEVSGRSETKAKAPWSGLWYVNAGDGAHRSWEDMRRYGFISAGGGEKYTGLLQRLQPGARIVAYQKGAGYVGYGRVSSPSVTVNNFQTKNGPLLEQSLAQPGINWHADDPQKAEYAVGVDWLKAVPIAEAKRYNGAPTLALRRPAEGSARHRNDSSHAPIPPSGGAGLNQRMLSSLEALSRASSFLIAVVGLAVLLGWHFDIELLRAGLPGCTPVNPATGLALLLAACALWMHHQARGRPDSTPVRWLALTAASLVIALGVITLTGYFIGHNLRVDQLLRMLPVAILVPAVLGWLTVSGQRAALFREGLGHPPHPSPRCHRRRIRDGECRQQGAARCP